MDGKAEAAAALDSTDGPSKMLWKLILLLTAVPIVELCLLVKLSEWTSLSLTLLVILGTGVVGAILARAEGLRVLRNIQREIAKGKLPADGLLDGAMVLVAAALLLTPGLLTDAVGLLLLFPPSRSVARRMLKRWIKRKIETGRVRLYRSMGFGPTRDEPPPGAPPLEGKDAQDQRQ